MAGRSQQLVELSPAERSHRKNEISKGVLISIPFYGDVSQQVPQQNGNSSISDITSKVSYPAINELLRT